MRQGNAKENRLALGPHEGCGFFFITALGMKDGDDFSEDEGKGDENRRQDDAGNGEDDLNVRP